MASNAKNLAEYLNNQTTSATADIADGSITTAKLADDAVTTAKLSNDAVGADQLADNSVVTANITSGAISTIKVADGAITTDKVTGVGGAGKNVIINGSMQVAQRGTSSTGLGAANGYFTCDRYRHVFSGTAGRLTSSQSSDAPAGFGKSLKFDCTTADTSIAAGEYFFFSQKIEGQHLQHFAKGTSSAKAFAVSFYVKGNAAATYALELYDADNNRQCSKSFSVTTSWNRVELIFPADTTGAFGNDNAESLTLSWWLHAGTTFTSGTLNSSAFAANNNANRALSTTSFFDSTNRTFFITGIKLEPVQVTDFEHETFEETLRRCQRYYLRAGGANYANLFGVGGIANTTGSWFGLGYIPVPMRAGFTLVQSGGTPRIQNGQAGYNASSISMSLQSTHGTGLSAGCNASGLTLYRWHNFDAGASAALFELDAEL